MAHTWVTQAPLVVKTALNLFQRSIVLPALVYRDAEADFSGKTGTVVNIKRPALKATTTNVGMDASVRSVTGTSLTQTTFPLTIDEYPLNAVDLSDEELTFSVEDFSAEVLAPQIRGIVEYIEDALATHMVSATNAGQLTLAADGSDFLAKVTNARKLLNNANVPQEGRVLVMGADVEELALNLAILTEADKSGSTGALRDAIIGRLRGFNVVFSNALPADVAIAMHPTAFSLVTRAPSVPQGVPYGASLSGEGGFALRHIQDYDSVKLVNRSVVGTYMGIDSILDGGAMKRAVQLDIT